ncbi:hypothetical protein FQZ97_1071080 [compost metagenome]
MARGENQGQGRVWLGQWPGDVEHHPRETAEAPALQGGQKAGVGLLLAVIQAHGGSAPGAPVVRALQAGGPGTPLLDPEMHHARVFPAPSGVLVNCGCPNDKRAVGGSMAKCGHYLGGMPSAQTLQGSSDGWGADLWRRTRPCHALCIESKAIQAQGGVICGAWYSIRKVAWANPASPATWQR